MPRKSVIAKCEACGGSGIYTGFAEQDGAAVVCYKCKGTGKVTIKYEEFKEREVTPGIRRVFRTNVGVGIGENKALRLEDFGGLSYEDWLSLKDPCTFPKGTEMRSFTCPAWWYQGIDSDLKPKCDFVIGRRFPDCDKFCDKEACWFKWDEEFGSQ